MAEYIKREDVLALTYYDGIGLTRWEVVEADDIKAIPAADVAPVVHGRWLLRHEGHGHYWECSVCHENPCIYVTKNTKFCSNCGAKMDLED